MASITAENRAEVPDAEYGIELKEVDFKEFERRKVPRMSSYALFVKSLEPSSVEIEFIV